ncbi:hypothetical protein Pmani_020476 [Petrolisthes manimaculis]|uniref:Fibronectin type-III domain-containing protein n=1 Tax=Petrolisthes manimaculis TaxID=1843537 RepID=A0AAE1PIK7_9EUCA|nr:hypothetical protein Pmani_020476 [Petrolisthes manimaculis]
MYGVTRDHEWITREGIRRNIRQFFLDHPPENNPSIYLPTDASLTQLFHVYYGDTASPTRFIKAVNSIAMANVKTDSSHQYRASTLLQGSSAWTIPKPTQAAKPGYYNRYDPAIHSDGEQLDAVQQKLLDRYSKISASVIDEAYPAVRSLLGTSLHSIQKFYAHSTWIEQGNTGILEGLGIPGNTFDGMLAEATEDVCTSCPSSQGYCSGNVISGAGLSSGYYTYPSELGASQLVPKPTTGGKCSHGGLLDVSSYDEAKGGVNKDTTSPCFSPHHNLHADAAEAAVQATDYYLKHIERVIGVIKYRILFDLYQGTSLSISIDTTGSMGDDIEAVKDQVARIVANTVTEVYILSQFNDPGCGPVYKTSDPDEFLDAINALYPNGGGDGPELFWCGLQKALSETPDYGDVFCFTDAEAKDGELMDGVISLAQRQNNKVTVILSDILTKNQEKQEERKGEGRDLITGIDGYQRLVDATGGLLISAEKFDIDEIANIIGSSVENATVSYGVCSEVIQVSRLDVIMTTRYPLRLGEPRGRPVTQEKSLAQPGIEPGSLGFVVTILQQETSADLSVEVPIDDSVFDCELRISGQTNTAFFTDPTGKSYDLMDRIGLNAESGVEVITHTDTLKAVRWLSPSAGMWVLTTTLADPTHSITLQATSTLDFLNDFAVLDPSPPHPHYRPIEGQPLMRVVLREVDYPFGAKDQAYIRTDPLPDQPFYIRVVGFLGSGNRWMRYSGVEVWPVETGVDLYATSEELSAHPGESATANFLVTNYGIESYFTITGIDDLYFLKFMVPNRVFLSNNESVEVEAQFFVPLDATHGQVSTAIVTARSELQTQNVNSAIAHFIVLSSVVDLSLPTCTLTNTPDCTGYLTNGVCSGLNWTANAIFRDSGSGLYSVHSEPEPLSLTTTGLTPGTTSDVTADFVHSCCSPQAVLRGVDGMGNAGECNVNMGILGGVIENFHVDTAEATYLVLKWNITPSDIPIDHYDLNTDSTVIHQSLCKELECIELVNYLEQCSVHEFVLTPYFDDGGVDEVAGTPAFTQGSTLDGGDPQTPTDGLAVDATANTITVSWQPPNLVCAYTYEVCHYEVNTDPGLAICDTTTITSHTLRELEECKAYFIDVATTNSNGLTSSPLNFYSVTHCTEIIP